MTQKQEEVLAIINTIIRVKVAPSKIHGVGVFAMRNIPKGTRLYMTMFPQGYKVPYGSFKKISPDIREHIMERWPRVVNNEPFMWPDTLLQSYCNHSDTPNYDCLTDITLEDIKKGEEILEDYRTIPGHEKAFPFLKKLSPGTRLQNKKL